MRKSRTGCIDIIRCGVHPGRAYPVPRKVRDLHAQLPNAPRHPWKDEYADLFEKLMDRLGKATHPSRMDQFIDR